MPMMPRTIEVFLYESPSLLWISISVVSVVAVTFSPHCFVVFELKNNRLKPPLRHTQPLSALTTLTRNRPILN
ncbi:hypothetical protein PJL15_02866 [Paenarthrobacter nitroguajacolicus]|nr:hypothetical protein [Paenarthrobacter nitroguajacolicus]